MLSWWFLSDTHMSWFSSTDPKEGKSGLSEGGCCIRWFEFWKRLSYREWRSHLYKHYIVPRSFLTLWRKLFCLWFIAWLLLSVWILYFMISQATEKRRETLSSMCDERARMLQDQFNVSMNHVQALSILVNTFHHSKAPSAIDQATFAKYAERTAFERPLTSGVAYAVKVLHSERAEFEKQQGWIIKKMYSHKQDQLPGREDDSFTESQEPSPIQEEYAPVIFAQDTIKHVVSFDMLTGEEDRENILRARMSGKGVLTAPFRLLKSDRLGVILTFAVYKPELLANAAPEERIKAAIGYIGGVFDIESLVDKLLHQLACKQSITVNVYDTTSAAEPISMYGSNITANRICHVSSLNFGDPYRKHEMHCRFKNKPPIPWLAITSSIGALVIGFLLGYIIHATVNRIAKVEDDYRQMMELKKLAEDADVAKSQFLATVSHEIRTPMNGVLGMLQMLIDTDLDITQQDYVRTAQASGKTLVALINEVLDQAKIESGKIELEAVQFDFRSILDDVLSLFSGKSQEKGLELAAYVSDLVPEVLIGDPGRIRQIITNLMGNSIKFTEKGHIFVTVHLAEEVVELQEKGTLPNYGDTLSGFPVADRRNNWKCLSILHKEGTASQMSLSSTPPYLVNLVISVEDTGIGIPSAAQSRIFTPFVQVDPSITRIHGGTGIGLSISKCLVGLMRGEIVFTSEERIGSTFTFTAALSRGAAKCNGYNKPTEFQGMMALVVDRKPVRAMVTKYHLRRLGIDVETATDSTKALHLIKSGPATLNMVLIDKEVWFADTTLWTPFVGKEEVGRKGSPKFFLLTNPSSSNKVNAAESMGVVPTVIMKPLRATMLAVSIQRSLGVGGKENGRHETLPSSSFRSLLRGRRILVVDDNLVNLRVAAGALKKYGAEVATADSGKAAIEMLKPPHEFDACFMDIQMPETDGFEATKKIRENEGIANRLRDVSFGLHKNITHWHTPILAMTADVIQATHEECVKCGMDGYVSKPFDGEQLYREVARFFNSTSKKTQ